MTINVHRDGLLGSPNYAVGTEVLLVNGEGKFEPQATGSNLCRAAWRRNAVQDAQEEAPLPSGYRFDHSKELNCLHRPVAICDEISNLAIQFDSNVRATEFLHSTVLLAVCGSAEAVDCPKTVKGSRSIGALKMRDLGTVKGPHLGCRSSFEFYSVKKVFQSARNAIPMVIKFVSRCRPTARTMSEAIDNSRDVWKQKTSAKPGRIRNTFTCHCASGVGVIKRPVGNLFSQRLTSSADRVACLRRCCSDAEQQQQQQQLVA
ncbi:hypothetical protein T08_13457 [Trichinella sp. T8]|nr:hypothetical protein T08_13457 [Trichinella sp. T8]